LAFSIWHRVERQAVRVGRVSTFSGALDNTAESRETLKRPNHFNPFICVGRVAPGC